MTCSGVCRRLVPIRDRPPCPILGHRTLTGDGPDHRDPVSSGGCCRVRWRSGWSTAASCCRWRRPGLWHFPMRQVAERWEWAAEDTRRTDPHRLRELFTPQHINGRLIDPLELRMPHQYDFEYRDDYETQHRRRE